MAKGNVLEGILAQLAISPDSQLEPRLKARFPEILELPVESRPDAVIRLLDEIVHLGLASDSVIQVLDFIWNQAILEAGGRRRKGGVSVTYLYSVETARVRPIENAEPESDDSPALPASFTDSETNEAYRLICLQLEGHPESVFVHLDFTAEISGKKYQILAKAIKDPLP